MLSTSAECFWGRLGSEVSMSHTYFRESCLLSPWWQVGLKTNYLELEPDGNQGCSVANTALLGTLCSPKVLAESLRLGSELVPFPSSVPLQSTPVFLPWKSHGQRRLPVLQSMGSQRVRRDLATEQAGHSLQAQISTLSPDTELNIEPRRAALQQDGPELARVQVAAWAGVVLHTSQSSKAVVTWCFRSITNGHPCSVQGQCWVSGSLLLNCKL